MNTDDEERVCLRIFSFTEERCMDDKLVCDEVHLRTLSQSPLALQRQLQRRQSNQSTQSTTKTSTPLQRRRCSGGNDINISNKFELPPPPLAQHELLDDDDDDPKCQQVSVKNSMLDITDNGDSGVGADDETDYGVSNPAAQTEDSDGVVVADTYTYNQISFPTCRKYRACLAIVPIQWTINVQPTPTPPPHRPDRPLSIRNDPQRTLTA